MKQVGKTLGVIFGLLALFATPLPVRADSVRYVSDQLIVTVRASESPDAQILTTLKTGTPVTVLGEDGRYLKVKTEQGVEGYVLKQYLVAATPKPVIIAGLKKERDRLAGQVASLQKSRDAVTQKLATLRQAMSGKVQQAQGTAAQTQAVLAANQKKLQETMAKYTALKKNSQQVVALVNERDRLKSENAKLSSEAESLRKEESHLLFTGMIQWFLAGGGVFFLGWLIGKMSRKKRRSF